MRLDSMADIDRATRLVFDPFHPYLARRVGWRWQVFEDCADGVVRSLYLGPFWREVNALKVAQALHLARVHGERDQYAVEHGDPVAAMSDMSGVTAEMRGVPKVRTLEELAAARSPWSVPEGFEVSPEDEAAMFRAPGHIHYGGIQRITSANIPNRIAWPDPDDAMMKRPEFLAIWDVIVGWDIAVPAAYTGYTGAMGNHVRAILDGLDGLTWEGERYSDLAAKRANWALVEPIMRGSPVPCKWPDCVKGAESPPRGRCECSV